MAGNPFSTPGGPPSSDGQDLISGAGHVVAQVGRNFASDYGDRVHQAASALVKDFTTPATPVEQMTAGSPVGGRTGTILNDAMSYLGAPISGAADTIFGRPVAQLTGGRVSKQQAGDVAQLAVPGAGEVITEAKIAKAAKEAGVSVEALRANLEARGHAVAADNSAAEAKRNAARRLIGQGKLDSRASRASAAEHKAVGAGNPTLLDTMAPPAQRVVRSAGAKLGEADTVLEEHRRNTRNDVAARTTQRTEQLSPHVQAIEQRREALAAQRDNLAKTQYREPYAQPIQTDENLFEALNSPHSFSAMADAAATARERMYQDPEAAQQYHELVGLRDYYTKRAAYEHDLAEWETGPKGHFTTQPSAETQTYLDNPRIPETTKDTIRQAHGWTPEPKPEAPPMPVVSGGSLDRVRISLRDKADTLSKAGKRGRAGGVGERYRALDQYLDGLPHLKEARAAYADYSRRIDQLDFDRDLSTMRPEAFKAHVAELTPEQREELVHSISERLAAAFGKSSRGAQSKEDILTTGHNAQTNLRELLGKEKADTYLRAMDLIGQGVDKANFVASRVGSQTAMIGEDAAETGKKAAVWAVTGSHHMAIHTLIRFLDRHFSGLQPEEAQQIAEWATQQQDVTKTLREIADAAEWKPEKGTKPPKVEGMPPELLALVTGKAAVSGMGGSGQGPQGSQAAAPGAAGPGKNPFAPPDGDDVSAIGDIPEDAQAPTDDAAPPTDAPADEPTGNAMDDLLKQYAPGYKPTSGPGPSGQVGGGSEAHPELLDLVRKLEGSGDHAVSPKGAIGRFQIMPATADQYGLDKSRLRDPAYSRYAAGKILADLSEKFGGDQSAILVGYNAGPARAQRWLDSGKDPASIPPETRKYLKHAGLLGADDTGGSDDTGGDMDALVREYSGKSSAA